jgi:sugar phosphate isomerase/epimerase
MAVACSTSAFKVSLDEALGRVARLGFQYVDLICISGWGHVMADELLEDFDGGVRKIEQMLTKHGLTPVAMNMAFGHLHQRGDADAVKHRLRQADVLAQLMNRLGVEVASFFPGGRSHDRPWQEAFDDEIASIRELLEVARNRDVTFAPEPHFNTILETLEQNRRLLEAIPELTVAYDPSHFALQSIPLSETQFILDRASHVHLRDAAPEQMTAMTGEGTVDFDWIFDQLHARGYEGHYSIEYLPKLEGDLDQAIVDLKRKIESRLNA